MKVVESGSNPTHGIGAGIKYGRRKRVDGRGLHGLAIEAVIEVFCGNRPEGNIYQNRCARWNRLCEVREPDVGADPSDCKGRSFRPIHRHAFGRFQPEIGTKCRSVCTLFVDFVHSGLRLPRLSPMRGCQFRYTFRPRLRVFRFLEISDALDAKETYRSPERHCCPGGERDSISGVRGCSYQFDQPLDNIVITMLYLCCGSEQ